MNSIESERGDGRRMDGRGGEGKGGISEIEGTKGRVREGIGPGMEMMR